jgi:drug/metabolite transporter (DMT)-like permease
MTTHSTPHSPASPPRSPASQVPHPTRATLELVFASSLWGFGFIAVVWALEAMSPLEITGWRFAIATSLGLIYLKFGRRELWTQVGLAAWPGFLVAGTVMLQTWGLQYTTATKSGFLTCLYVLIVPLLEAVTGRQKLHMRTLICGAIALMGVGLMTGLDQALGWSAPSDQLSPEMQAKMRLNWGDVLTLGCALAASGHIIAVGRAVEKVRQITGREVDSFRFNVHQSLWAGVPLLALTLPIFGVNVSPLGDEAHAWPLANAWAAGWKPIGGLIMLAVGSTLIAFALQVRAQKSLDPSLASLIFLLESPFAAIFAFWLLGETLGGPQLLGAALIMGSVAIASWRVADRSPAPPGSSHL